MRLIIKKSTGLEQLIDQCQRNKPDAQRLLYERLSPKMLGVCRRYIGEASEAEHVLVAGFLKVFTKINQFRASGSSQAGGFEGWVRKIMVNESLLYIRQHKNMYLEVDIADAEIELDYSKADYMFEEQELLKLIDELPIGYRTVFNLYAIEGYSHNEISGQLNISINTSKSQLSRARTLLKSKVAELENQYKQNRWEYGK